MSVSGHVKLGGDPEADPEDLGGIVNPIWNTSGSPMKSWRMEGDRGMGFFA